MRRPCSWSTPSPWRRTQLPRPASTHTRARAACAEVGPMCLHTKSMAPWGHPPAMALATGTRAPRRPAPAPRRRARRALSPGRGRCRVFMPSTPGLGVPSNFSRSRRNCSSSSSRPDFASDCALVAVVRHGPSTNVVRRNALAMSRARKGSTPIASSARRPVRSELSNSSRSTTSTPRSRSSK